MGCGQASGGHLNLVLERLDGFSAYWQRFAIAEGELTE
jgi:hypothetical protein